MAALAHLLGHPIRFAISTLKITCLAHLAGTHLVQVSPARGPSMLPTLAVDGDWLAADMTARRGRRLRVGDLVLYRIPVLPAVHGVKRVVGLPGDFVALGEPGSDQHMIQVPEGHCWIVGDNLSASRDSRQLGPLPLALIQGKIVAKVLPWRERSWIENPLQPLTQPEP